MATSASQAPLTLLAGHRSIHQAMSCFNRSSRQHRPEQLEVLTPLLVALMTLLCESNESPMPKMLARLMQILKK